MRKMALLFLSIRPPSRKQNPLGYLLCPSFVLSRCQAFCRHSLSGTRLSYLLWYAKISFLYPSYLVCLFFQMEQGVGLLKGEEDEGMDRVSCASVSPELYKSCSGCRSDTQDPWKSEAITPAHQTFAAVRKNSWRAGGWPDLIDRILCLNLAYN